MHIWTCVFSQLCRLLLLLPVLHFSDAVNRRAHPEPSGTSNPHTVEQVRRSARLYLDVHKEAALMSCDLVGRASADTIQIGAHFAGMEDILFVARS